MSQVWLFDIDGTLIHSGGAGETAAVRTVASLFQVDETHGETHFAGRTDRAIMWDIFRFHQIEQNEANWDRFQAAYVTELQNQLQQRPGGVLPGVVPLIEAIQQQFDRPIGLLTGNTEAAAWIKLKHFAIDHLFHFGGFGDQHCDRNDVAQSAMKNAARQLQQEVTPEQIWVVGDTPNDIRCARAIGANVIAVATGNFSFQQLAEHQPDLVIHDLTDPAVHEVVTGD